MGNAKAERLLLSLVSALEIQTVAWDKKNDVNCTKEKAVDKEKLEDIVSFLIINGVHTVQGIQETILRAAYVPSAPRGVEGLLVMDPARLIATDTVTGSVMDILDATDDDVAAAMEKCASNYIEDFNTLLKGANYEEDDEFIMWIRAKATARGIALHAGVQ
jgi:hypothetical protein